MRREWPCFSYKTVSWENPPSPALQFITLTWPVLPSLHCGQHRWNPKHFIFISWFTPLAFIMWWHIYSWSFAHSEDSDHILLWNINYVCRTHDGPMFECSLCQTSERRHCIMLLGECFIAWILFICGFWPNPWWLFSWCPACALSGCSHSVTLHAFWHGFQIVYEWVSKVGANEIAALCFLYKFRLVWLLCCMSTLWFRTMLYYR